jgi:hypothetical protein
MMSRPGRAVSEQENRRYQPPPGKYLILIIVKYLLNSFSQVTTFLNCELQMSLTKISLKLKSLQMKSQLTRILLNFAVLNFTYHVPIM